MNLIESGDDYLQPLNMTTVGEKPAVPPVPPAQEDDQPPTEEQIQQAANALRRLSLLFWASAAKHGYVKQCCSRLGMLARMYGPGCN